MRVGLIDAGGANLGSVRYAVERLGAEVFIAQDADGLREADRVILPGVGAAGPAMALLQARGFVNTLRTQSKPLLGICLGMQVLHEYSEEGEVNCLGLLPGRVEAMQKQTGIRLPHMGWNSLNIERQSPLIDGLDVQAQAYFVHGYAIARSEHCVLSSEHGQNFSAMVQHGPVVGMQFHPERSAAVGRRLLENFLKWSP